MSYRSLHRPGVRAAVSLALAAALLAGCSGDDDIDFGSAHTPPSQTDQPESPPVEPGTPTSPLTPGGDADERVAARDYDATVVNPNDGTEIAITVFQPELAPGDIAPLILQSHGFGGSRLTGRDARSVYETASGGIAPSSEAARRAVEDGYFVISFDERGFGESGGQVEVMDPRFEGEDIKAILDWAEQQMDHRGHLGYRDGNLVVGALGLSYGGGFQLIGAGVDPRFDALVPTAAWNDLTFSLSPDDVIKTVWGVTLVTAGIPTSRVRLNPLLYQALVEGATTSLTGQGFSPAVKDKLYNNSPASFCSGMISEDGNLVPSPTGRTTPKVDALLIQGTGDSLFSYNEGVANAECLRAAGNDVQLVGMRFGHTLPLLQNLDDRIAYKTESTLHCGDQTYDTAALELDYLNWKLRGETLPQPIPDNCITIDDDTGLTFDAPPVGAGDAGGRYAFAGQAALGGLDLLRGVVEPENITSLTDLLGGTVDNAANLVRDLLTPGAAMPDDASATFVLARLLNALPADQIEQLTTGGTFIPLRTIGADGLALAGIPTMDVTITGPSVNPIAYVGVGVRHSVDSAPVLVDQQLRPIRGGEGQRTIELNGISQRLVAGDQVGLLVYGFHPQYAGSFSLIPGVVELSGDVALPFATIPSS